MQYSDFYKDIITEGTEERIHRYLPVLTGKSSGFNDEEYRYARDYVTRFNRDDIIKWFMRWHRAMQITLSTDASPRDKAWGKEYAKIINLPKNAPSEEDTKLADGFEIRPWRVRQTDRNGWGHFFSLPIPGIQNYRFVNQNPTKVFAHFKRLEAQWQKEQEGKVQWIDMTDELSYENGPNDFQVGAVKEIIKFNDGFSWFNLSVNQCRKEGNAMGHCGNTAGAKSTDTILSLRKVVKKRNRTFARPSLTFILDTSTRMLGEMKGRANEKPKPMYHPYIIKLLEHKESGEFLIQGFGSGGYEPEGNFAIDDLSDEQKTALYQARPDLKPLLQLYKETGLTEELKLLIRKKISPKSRDQIYIGTGPRKDKVYVTMPWNNWKEIPFTRAQKELRNYEPYMDDPTELFTSYDMDITKESVEYLFEEIQRDKRYNHNDMVRYIEAKYEEEAAEIDDYNNIFEFLYAKDDKIIDELNTAYSYGYTNGVEAELSRRFFDAITDLYFLISFDNDTTDTHVGIEYVDPTRKYDSPLYTTWEIKDFVNAIDHGFLDPLTTLDDLEHDLEGDMVVPRDGFDGFDDKSAIDTFFENYQSILDNEIKTDIQEGYEWFDSR